MRTASRFLGATVLVALLAFHPQALAQGKVKVMSDSRLRPAFEQLAEQFRGPSAKAALA